MPFPFLGNYLWGEGKGIAQRHFRTAKREHEDLSEIARILNNISVEIVSDIKACGIDKNGDNWKIKVYAPGADMEDELEDVESDISLREVDVCVNGQIKKMKILGSLPY
jgi:hypothetical protein